jgi:putative tryptophan/tyrosine transport system substrate-binding protein
MRRREFITLVGGVAAVASPFTVLAQQPALRRVGILIGTAENDPLAKAWIAAFESGLEELGWKQDRNVRFDVFWGNAIEARIREQAVEIVKQPPDVIFAVGTAVTGAITQATTSVPVVFAVVNDPVAQGYVSSMAKPGGNITGFSLMDYSVLGKAMELLGQITPAIKRIAFLFNPDTYPYYETYLKSVHASAAIPFEVTALRTRSAAEIEPAIAGLGSDVGLLVAPDTFTNVNRAQIIRSAAQRRIPATYPYRFFAVEGGLMAYGPNPTDVVRRAATYVDRILKGAKPADLPVQAPTRYDFVLNLKTAAQLGLEIPPTLLARADEVIE